MDLEAVRSADVLLRNRQFLFVSMTKQGSAWMENTIERIFTFKLSVCSELHLHTVAITTIMFLHTRHNGLPEHIGV